MREWWTYRPEDFLLFSDRVYWRLFELHNAAVWPAQIAALLLGAAILVLTVRPRPWSGRVIALALAAAWLFVAWTFLWLRFRPINWAAGYAVAPFVVEALLLVWLGGVRGRLAFGARGGVGGRLGLAVFAYALLAHPFVAVLAGRPLAGAEIFAIAPDPLAIGTLGLLATAKVSRSGGRLTVVALFAVPLLWCGASAATLATMGTWEAWIPLVAAVAAVVAAVAARAWPHGRTPPT